jgi:hypothetical protein
VHELPIGNRASAELSGIVRAPAAHVPAGDDRACMIAARDQDGRPLYAWDLTWHGPSDDHLITELTAIVRSPTPRRSILA